MILTSLLRLKRNTIMMSVPFFILFVFLPVLVALLYFFYKDNPEAFLRESVRHLHVWIPLFASWWSLLLVDDFFDDEGNELLYLDHRPLYFPAAWCVTTALYGIFTAVFFVVVKQILPVGFFLLAQLVVESIFMSFLSFALCFLFLNTGISFLAAVFYCVYLNLFDSLRLLSFLSVFPEESIATPQTVNLCRDAGLAAVLFFAGGFLCARFHRCYK